MVPLGMSSDEIETSGYSHPMVRLWSPSRVGFARGKKPEAIMVEKQPLTLDAKTIALVSEVLEAAWDSIPPPQKATMQKSTLAVILKSESSGRT